MTQARSVSPPQVFTSFKKLFPCGIERPKLSATVCPISASVARTPRFAPAPLAGEYARIGTYSREWSVVPARIGVAAVVRGDEQQVRRAQESEERAQHAVELFERFREALDIFAMAVQHVEIDQIAENQARFSFLQSCGHFCHAVRVAGRGDVFLHAAAV